ncbi:hypothetical protein AB0L71_28090 [Streptomyces sp. NPDC052052]|uniref:hypothetical protein n=1 Tax=Streptomyces sp. NPDC052052 TaxID=3154756 RepID=UPI00341FBACD
MYVDFNSLPDTRTPGINPLTKDQLIASIAYHEAAHAVTGMTFGMSLARTRVHTIDVDGYMGWTGTTTWNTSYVLCANLAIELAAGVAAGTRYLRDNNLLTPASAAVTAAPHDRDMAFAALAKANYPITLDGPAPENGTTWAQATSAATDMVDDLWAQITAVAEELIADHRHKLTGDQVAGLIGLPNPPAAA